MDFFKEFSKQLSGRGRSAPEKPKEALNRLNARVRAAEEELELLFARYGRACYDRRQGRGDADETERLAARVQSALLQVEELTAARDAAMELKRCPGCGAVCQKDARFCSACGRKLPEDLPRPEPVEAGEYCPACGAKREGGELRCPVCGADLSAPPEPAAEAPIPAPVDLPAPEEPDGAIE